MDKRFPLLYVFIFSFFMPKINLSIPPKNFGLLITTTFINIPPNYLQHDNPKMIIQIDSTAIRNFGGQKQLISSPKANVIVTIPLLIARFLITHPPILYCMAKMKKCYTLFGNYKCHTIHIGNLFPKFLKIFLI